MSKSNDQPQFDPRRAPEPGWTADSQDHEGPIRLKADDDGVVQPRNQREENVAIQWGLPVARSVVTERKAAARTSSPRTRPARSTSAARPSTTTKPDEATPTTPPTTDASAALAAPKED